MSYRSNDPQLEQATNKWMVWGLVFMALMMLIFPLYLWYEPSSRAEALESHQNSLAEQGGDLYGFNCVSCHGPDGVGGIGPALNSQQFLTSADDTQIKALIAVGIPGSLMSAYALDFGGPLTSEQIDALTAYLRSWEEDAPDNPDWRVCCQ
jgi:mono/diheme cytochrome c family protein